MGSRDRSGEGIAALAGGRTAEAIVPALETDDPYPRIVRRGATDVAASRCRQGSRPLRRHLDGEKSRHEGGGFRRKRGARDSMQHPAIPTQRHGVASELGER